MEESESKSKVAPELEIPNGNVEEEFDPRVEEKESEVPSEGFENGTGVGSRALTMRELLNELKDEAEGAGRKMAGDDASAGDDAWRASTAASDGSRRDGVSSFSVDSVPQHPVMQNDVSMELINKVSGIDDEGRSRQKILVFSAKRLEIPYEEDDEQ